MISIRPSMSPKGDLSFLQLFHSLEDDLREQKTSLTHRIEKESEDWSHLLIFSNLVNILFFNRIFLHDQFYYSLFCEKDFIKNWDSLGELFSDLFW